MALHPVTLTRSLQSRLIRKVRTLSKKGILPFTEVNNVGIQLGFWLYIQNIPRKQISSLAVGRPEGIRIMAFENKKLLVGLDFIFKGKRIFFSGTYRGPALDILVGGINQLEKRYRTKKKNQEVQYIHFLFDPLPYLMIKDGKFRKYFHFPKAKLKEITPEKLQAQVLRILKKRIIHSQ